MLDWVLRSRAYRLKAAKEEMATALRAWNTSARFLCDITRTWSTRGRGASRYTKAYNKLVGPAEKRASRALSPHLHHSQTSQKDSFIGGGAFTEHVFVFHYWIKPAAIFLSVWQRVHRPFYI